MVVKTIPIIIPDKAPCLFIFLSKIPKIIAGKKDEAAKPNASATTSATKPGGFNPARPAATTATAIEILAAHNSPFSEIFGLIFFFKRSCEIDVEITRSKPAAVESAAANPPATINPITHAGKLAISGFAKP